jgi:hypothetical protein
VDGWTIFTWCLIRNHDHLVLKTTEIALRRSLSDATDSGSEMPPAFSTNTETR